jgi:hypothetical protein
MRRRRPTCFVQTGLFEAYLVRFQDTPSSVPPKSLASSSVGSAEAVGSEASLTRSLPRIWTQPQQKTLHKNRLLLKQKSVATKNGPNPSRMSSPLPPASPAASKTTSKCSSTSRTAHSRKDGEVFFQWRRLQSGTAGVDVTIFYRSFAEKISRFDFRRK